MVARRWFADRRWLVVGLATAMCGVWGCPARTLLITQDPYINNAMHRNLAEGERTGDPLEVSIVCVYPEDLEKPVNQGLRPGQNVDCRGWYEHRPVAGGGDEAGRFDLPASQVYLLTKHAPAQVYGQKRGPELSGAVRDGKSEIRVAGIRFEGGIHNRDSVIYVFPRFTDRNGEVLPVPPATFHPPGAYTSQIAVKIGVNMADIREPSRNYGQFIEVTSPRR